MSALYGSATHVQRRTDPLVNAERLSSYRSANYVDHCIDRADFVKMDALDRSVVNLRLCGAQSLEDADRDRFRRTTKGSLFDNLPNLLQPASVLMLGMCGDGSLTRPGRVRDPAPHVLIVLVSVRMRMFVRVPVPPPPPPLFPEHFPRQIFFSVGVHINFGRG